MADEYNYQQLENKWQKHWEDHNIFAAELNSDKPKYYVLEMLPYPSGRIHMGHLRNYTLGDVTARYKRMQNFNVLHPMGWDAFGLPAENAAMENKTHPSKWTYENIANMRVQLKSLGLSYDWSREFATCDKEYYKQEQKIFLSFLNAGLAYQKESYVNWDPVDQTVLANEQVVDGKGWRSGAPVERRKLRQWFLKVTDFAEDLLESIDTKLQGWPEAVKSIQKKWIGKSHGALVLFDIADTDKKLEIYTTRPETIVGGASFCAIAPTHPLSLELAKNDPKIASFISECDKLGTSEEIIEKAEKKGIYTGLKARNPFNDELYPLYIANFVLMDYGTGALFGCPAHDARDYEFAKKYKLPIRTVIKNLDASQDELYLGDGIMINSSFLDGLTIAQAKEKAIEAIIKNNYGKVQINYRIRDWGVSRQRYWGCPIPIIHCDDCGIVPVKEADLPIGLPDDVHFDIPGNPLDHHPTWKHIKCHQCGKDALRETDTFDTFFESSWYFLRYCSPKSNLAFDRDITEYWAPVDQYIGGIEHAAMHLLYARFFIKALKKCGYINLDEPFTNLLTQGMVLHQTYKDKNGKWLYPEEARGRQDVIIGRIEKMSKSKKNVVDPEHIVKKYGADTARFFMMSDSPPERDLEWSDSGIQGSFKFLRRLWVFTHDFMHNGYYTEATYSGDDIAIIAYRKNVHKLLESITKNIEKMSFNSAIANIRELANLLFDANDTDKKIAVASSEALRILIIALSPFAPHITEELWHVIGNKESILNTTWPIADGALLVDNTVTIAIQINGKLKGTTQIAKSLDGDAIEKHVLELEFVKRNIEALHIKKIIIVPDKIVNIVV
jgi:leucyl-tRNA synthetase